LQVLSVQHFERPLGGGDDASLVVVGVGDGEGDGAGAGGGDVSFVDDATGADAAGSAAGDVSAEPHPARSNGRRSRRMADGS
jgi:hypothetical protein